MGLWATQDARSLSDSNCSGNRIESKHTGDAVAAVPGFASYVQILETLHI